MDMIKYNEFEKYGINTFCYNDMFHEIMKTCENVLINYEFEKTCVKNILSDIQTKILDIPKTIRNNDMIINDVVILNDYPLFKNNLGDAICIFMVRYYRPFIWDNHIYIIDCDGGVEKTDENVFLSIYYNNALLSL